MPCLGCLESSSLVDYFSYRQPSYCKTRAAQGRTAFKCAPFRPKKKTYACLGSWICWKRMWEETAIQMYVTVTLCILKILIWCQHIYSRDRRIGVLRSRWWWTSDRLGGRSGCRCPITLSCWSQFTSHLCDHQDHHDNPSPWSSWSSW